MSVALEVAPILGVVATCLALGLPRPTYYRHRTPVFGPKKPRPAPPRSLSPAERQVVLDVLHEPRFADVAPAEVQATLLEENRYLCSPRTMHRILAASSEARERRNQLRHANHPVPVLLATKPKELWSWDITKLLGPGKWTYFYLYVVLDVFSRYVVGWMLAPRESASLAKKLIGMTCQRQGIQRNQLTVHADRGSSMKSKPLAFLLADLGVHKTHSRPSVSNDNAFSESHFKTLKYRPDFPKRFGCIEDGRAHCGDFFAWYNNDHHHSGLAMLTPHDVHHGLVAQRMAERAAVLDAAYRAHPERFPHGPPKVTPPPSAVWINRPKAPDGAPAPEMACEVRALEPKAGEAPAALASPPREVREGLPFQAPPGRLTSEKEAQ
jgi:putative transposase